MPSSHLPRTSCDKFVYDFPCDFWGIVGGYGLRHMFTLSTASCNFFYGASRATRGKSVQIETVRRLYENRAMSVQLPSSLRSLRTEIVRSPCGDCEMPPTCMTCLQATVLRFSKFVKLLAKPNRRGRGARESVRKSHNRLLPPQGGLAEAARKGDTGRIRAPQTHRTAKIM